MHNLTLTQIVDYLDKRQFSSAEITRHFLARIARLDPVYNSFITVTNELALAQASDADQRRTAGNARPLDGVPLAHKDIFCTQGVRTSCGSKMLDNFVPPYDATVVTRFKYVYAVGDAGTIIFSSDYGATWAIQNDEMEQNLYDISVTDSITAWAVGDDGLILNTTDGGFSWNEQNSNSIEGLNSVFFINNQIGWACGDAKTIIRTNDGGNTWNSIDPSNLPAAVSLNSLYFKSVTEGWAVGSNGLIIHTTNSGTNWEIQRIAGRTITRVKVIDNYVIACGDSGLVYITTNFGTKWNTLQSPTKYGLNDITIYDMTNIQIVADNGIILNSTNYGMNWTTDSLKTYASINGIAELTGTILIVGENGLLASNSGTWKFINNGMSPCMNWVSFSDPLNGIAVGFYGAISKTSDGGRTWLAINNGVTFDSFYGAEAIGNNVWAVGDEGVIIHSSDKGTTWEQQETDDSTDSMLSINFLDENNGWATGGYNNGVLYQTDDGGVSWNPVNIGTTQVINSVKFTDSLNGWIVGYGGLMKHTTDGGTTWSNINTNTSAILFNIDFINSNLGFCAGTNGLILRTTNAGVNWSSINSTTNQNLYLVEGKSSNSIWSIGDSGTVLNSTDGGTIWSAETFLTDFAMYGLKVLSDTTIYVVGDNGTIINTGIMAAAAIMKTIQLISPEGGETWQTGSTLTIRWTSQNIDSLKIMLSVDNKKTWLTQYNSYPAAIDTVNISISSSLANSDSCYIKIVDVSTDTAFSINKIPFSIKKPIVIKTIQLISPAGGEVWQTGSTQVIKWTSQNIDSINLKLSIDNKNTWLTLLNYCPAIQDTANVQISDTLPNSNNCYIKVSDFNEDTIFSINQNPFSIKMKTSVSETNDDNQNFNIFYNNNGQIEFSINNSVNEQWQLEIYDILGNKILFFNNFSESENIILNENNFVSGIYFCRLIENQGVNGMKYFIKKFIVVE